MIDIETPMFDMMAEQLRNRFVGIKVYGEELSAPSTFPCVSIVETDNTTKISTQDSGSYENHAAVVFTVNVYSNKTNGKKSECKTILSFIDNMLINLGFARTMKEHITMNNATVCRMIARYTATVSKNLEIYRR